jgi:hypothetical protein
MRLKLTFLAALVAAVAVTASAVPASAGVQAPGQTEFDGTVLSKNRDNRSFRLRDFERGTVRIFVTRNTRFERIAGFAGLKVGAKNIEAVVRKRDGRWVAAEVERSGRDDRAGDDDRGGNDRRGDDDNGGDRRGGRGGGDDD